MTAAVTDAVLARVRATGLLPDGGAVIVLLSGGQDSVCLLDVAVALAGRDAVRALHVEYGLRDEAAGDADHCAALCRRLEVPLDVEHARRPPESGNLQAWARDARYAAGALAAAASGARLAAGHTATDQVETILYRLATSPGRRALLGMPVRSGRLVRPLLGVTREETAAYCAARGLGWRTDATNETDRYARGRIRHGLVPALEAVDGRAAANVLNTAALLRDEAEVLGTVVETALAGRDHIAVDQLARLPVALARLVVRELAERAIGGRPCPRAAARLPELLELGDGALDVGDGARALVAGGVLRFGRTPPRPARGDTVDAA
ncbi:tRNA lysidine(34) synthetase TilS [Paraconexibacter antarcticus]|uniref:tRNA(Ile)-lysidine synthase n=1 Tax=Paraconexibacter antarcticus TaxID=2949664 RepID=A0ABY5DYT9_9ACTN|nr:tRNA lysidine(34) synthetase TilS [Paraconexibacter antarcticus]UTI65802.1 tRNA lysidine(34) synthetase TilS [Paraconexibacter antarcticus]